MTRVRGFTMKGVKRLRFPFCHCEEDDGPTRQSIVSPWMWRYAVDSPITGSEMMARGLGRVVRWELLVFDFFAVLVVFAIYFLPIFIPPNGRPMLFSVLVV